MHSQRHHQRLTSATVGFAACVVPGHPALDYAEADPQPPGGHEAGQNAAADCPGEVDAGARGDAGGLGDLVAGSAQRDGEAGPVGVGVGAGDRGSGVGDRGAQGLVGDQERVDLLLDAVGGAGAGRGRRYRPRLPGRRRR